MPLSLGFWLIKGSALGPIGGLSARQFNSCLPRREEKRREEKKEVHRAILLRDAAPVRSCRNIACSCGVLSGNRCHPTPSENSSDLEITWVVLIETCIGRLGLKTLTYDATIRNSSSLSSSISSATSDAVFHLHLIQV